jgi:uncharacterized protein (TIGR02996 family)
LEDPEDAFATGHRCASTLVMAKKRSLTPEQAFFQAIREAPADDTPRLVYADWLDENGQPERAEFIRLQYRLAAMDEEDSDRLALKDREWELQAIHGDQWRGAMPGWMRKEKHEFRRGFVSFIVLTGAQFLRKASAMYRTAPIAELRIRLAGLHRVPAIAASSALGRLRSLAIGGGLQGEQIRTLLGSPHLSGLQELNLAGNRLGEDGIRALVRWRGLHNLTALDISNNALDSGAVRTLVGSTTLGNLTHLSLGGNILGEVANDLAVAPSLGALRHLSLARCTVGVAGMEAIGKSELFPGLTSLSLSGLPPDCCRALILSPLCSQLTALDLQRTSPGAEIVEAIVTSSHLARLRRLDLGMNYSGDEAIQALARAGFSSLTTLVLSYNKLGAAGMTALADSPHLTSLEHLSIPWNNMGPAGALALASSRYLTNLRSLNLWGTSIGDEGAKHLAAWPGLAHLTTLILNVRSAGVGGVRALAASRYLSNLRVLELAYNTLTDEAAEALAASRSLRQLRKLVLYGNTHISPSGLKAIVESPHLPNLVAVNMRARGDDIVPRLAPSNTN